MLVAACLVALAAGVWLARGQSGSTQSVAPPATSSPSVPSTPLTFKPSPVPGQPLLGSGFSAVYDPAAHQLVVFGGIDSYDTTWLWDGRHWSLAQSPVSPPGRFRAAAAYDPATGVVMLYGGRLGPGQLVDDTWAWDGKRWRELDGGSGNPPQGEDAVMAWDGPRSQMVLVAGGQTWSWNGAGWVRRSGADLPSGTFLVGMAIDPVTRVLLGTSCCSVNQGAMSTLAWNGAAWHQLSTGAAPAFTVGVVEDTDSGRLLLFGDPSVAAGRELWSWTGRDWTLEVGARLPLFPAGAVTDTDTGHVLIVGSVAEPVQGHPQPMQLWSLTGTTWRRLQ